jgi:hypothetical protein
LTGGKIFRDEWFSEKATGGHFFEVDKKAPQILRGFFIQGQTLFLSAIFIDPCF